MGRANRKGGRPGNKPRGRGTGPAGEILRAAGKDGPQLIRSAGHRWTGQAEEIFLDALAASNNATWAAEQCGFSREAIYKRARRDPDFAERMAAARALAWGRIDEGLARAAEDFLDGRPADPGRPCDLASPLLSARRPRRWSTTRGSRKDWGRFRS